MTQPLDFSNQDLRNRSFKGQNLAGANFRKSDIRGCDFSRANLEGTDFSGATTGKSGKQIFMSVVFTVMFAVVVALVVSGVIASIIMVTGIYAGIEFAKGNVYGGIIYLSFCLFSICFFYFFWTNSLKRFNTTGTSFKGATLAKSKFMGAILKNCDFTDANIYQTDWTHTHFTRCKLSGNLDNQSVRELCITRIGTNTDFSSRDLSGLNLIGVNLRAAILAGANLNGTNLTQSDLENANLVYVQAIQTDFSKANFSGACIENWAITSETVFTNTICSHIYLDRAKTERKPASGSFEQGDFEKLVIQFTKTLDFLFRNGIDSQAFDFALNNLIEDYEEMGISLKGVDDLGDGDRLVRFNTVPDAPKAEMHAQFTQDYAAMHQQLEASRNKVWELQQKLDRIDLENKIERFELEKQLAIAIAKLEERPTSQYLQNLVYHQANQKFLYAPHSTFTDTMTDKSIQSGGGDISYVGRDNKGVSGKDLQGVAGRDISGTVTNTIQQLRETNQPEAPKLSELLEQLQKAVESSSELGEPDKQKALEYLNQIGEISAKDPSQKKGMLPILLDAFTGVISKAANLIDPVKKIAAAILSIWQA